MIRRLWTIRHRHPIKFFSRRAPQLRGSFQHRYVFCWGIVKLATDKSWPLLRTCARHKWIIWTSTQSCNRSCSLCPLTPQSNSSVLPIPPTHTISSTLGMILLSILLVIAWPTITIHPDGRRLQCRQLSTLKAHSHMFICPIRRHRQMYRRLQPSTTTEGVKLAQ